MPEKLIKKLVKTGRSGSNPTLDGVRLFEKTYGILLRKVDYTKYEEAVSRIGARLI